LSLANGTSSAIANTAATNSGTLTPATTAYWTDVLFRPQNPEQASLAWKRFAQADTTATDAQPAPSTDAQPAPSADTPPATPPTTTDDESQTPVQQSGPPMANNNAVPQTGTTGMVSVPAASDTSTMPSGADQTQADTTTPPAPANLAADKAEVGRILDIGMAN